MQQFEQNTIKTFLRQFHQKLGCNQKAEVVPLLLGIDPGIAATTYRTFLYDQKVGQKDLPAVAKAALLLIAKNRRQLIDDNQDKENSFLINCVRKILHDNNLSKGEMIDGEDFIAARFRDTHYRGNRHFLTGVYQLFRREKEIEYEHTDGLDQRIVCELMYVDSEKMSCILISANGNIYYGAVHINASSVATITLARAEDPGTIFRSIHLKLAGRIHLYSAVMIETGRILGYPISCDVFSVYLRRDDHLELYSEIAELYESGTHAGKVRQGSVIKEYINAIPPAVEGTKARSDALKVRDVKLFEAVVKDGSLTGGFFREPSRVLSEDTTRKLQRLAPPLLPFRKKNNGG